MLFSSIEYIFIFLPLTLVIYFLLIKQRLIVASKIWLILTSLFFYAYWNPAYLSILLLSIFINFAIGSSLNNDQFKRKVHKRSVMLFGITLNLLALGYYKYMDFFIQNTNAIFHTHLELMHILLPLGISFFTFQQITYIFDSYKGETSEYDFLNYTLFVCFFPQLIAGPIVHHKEMMPQFQKLKNKVLSHKNLTLGLFLFTIGLFKKVVLADTFSLYVASGFANNGAHLSIIEGWLVSLAYTFQIYFDFSGYTDMALGAGKMFNINLPINFNSPYKATSIQDFWRRWHITLSRFLKDYLYISLGGNRSGKLNTYRNLFLTFLIGGLWHGASWMFVIWGALHGFALCVHRFFKQFNLQINNKLSIFMTFIFVNFVWIFFRAENLETATNIIKSMLGLNGFLIPKISHLNLNFVNLATHHGASYKEILVFMPIAFIIVFYCKNSNEIMDKINITSKKKALKYAVIFASIFLIALIKMVFVEYSEFIYFNF